MHAHVQTLQREVNFGAMVDHAHVAIRKQKRSMVRGLIGLAAFTALTIYLSVATGDLTPLVIGLSMVGICSIALLGDLARLKLTREWGEKALRLDPAAARRERRKAFGSLIVSLFFAFVPLPLGEVIQQGVGLVALVGIFHSLFVIRTLSREIKSLRD